MDRREMAVNVFAGSVLVLVFAAIVAGGIAIAAVVLHSASVVVDHLFPTAAHHQRTAFVGFLGFSLLFPAFMDLRARRWRALFLDFALAAGLALICYQGIRSGQDCDIPIALIAVYGLPLPPNRDVERRSFLLGASLLSFAVLLNTGVLGSATLFRVANLFLYACVGVWSFMWLRKWPDNNASSNATSTA